MKYNLKIAAMILAGVSVCGLNVHAADIIAPPEGVVSFIGLEEGDYSLGADADSSKVIITKEGTLGILGGTTGNVAILKDGVNTAINILPHLSPENNVIDLSSYSVDGTVSVNLDINLASASKTNLLTVTDASGKVFAQIQLRFRKDNYVYIACKKDNYNYNTSLREADDKWLETGKDYCLTAVINMSDKNISLYNGDEVLFENAPFVGTPTGISKIELSAAADNVSIFSGQSARDAEIVISDAVIDVNTSNAMTNVNAFAKLHIFGSEQEIPTEYFSWSVKDNSVCTISKKGVITVDTASLQAPTDITLTASLSVGGKVLSDEQTITLNPSSSGGEAAAGVVIGGVSVSDTITAGASVNVSVPICNNTSSDASFYLVTALYDNSGKNIQNHVFKITAPANSGRVLYSKTMTAAGGSGLTAKVLVLDENFKVNLLKK